MFSLKKTTLNRLFSLLMVFSMVMGMVPTAHASVEEHSEDDGHDHSEHVESVVQSPYALSTSDGYYTVTEDGAVIMDSFLLELLYGSYGRAVNNDDPYGIMSLAGATIVECEYCPDCGKAIWALMSDGKEISVDCVCYDPGDEWCESCKEWGHSGCSPKTSGGSSSSGSSQPSTSTPDPEEEEEEEEEEEDYYEPSCDHDYRERGPYQASNSRHYWEYECHYCGDSYTDYDSCTISNSSSGALTPVDDYYHTGTATGTCSVCGQSCTVTGQSAHTWGASTYTPNDSSYHTEKKTCTGCGYQYSGRGAHQMGGKSNYRYTSSTQHSYSMGCSMCGYGTDGSIAGYENHTFGSTRGNYKYVDSNNHSYALVCTLCGGGGNDVAGTEAHQWTGDWVYTPYSSTQHKGTRTCAKCGGGSGGADVRYENHTWTAWRYSDYSSTYHRGTRSCTVCGQVDTQNFAHTWSVTGYTKYTETQHKTSYRCTTSGCGRTKVENESHNWGPYSYVDLDTQTSLPYDQHRGTRYCQQCNEDDILIEKHHDNNNDHYCDDCRRLLSYIITWHWYDEHTPVTETTKQYYFKSLVLPAVRGRMDYKFTGWFTQWGGVGDQWEAGDKPNYSAPKHLYASWKAIVDIQFDLTAPIITVTRSPVDTETPYSNNPGVKLTITATDPIYTDEEGNVTGGNDHDFPLQIEGETEWHKSPYEIYVTENKPFTIVARDELNNTRQFVVLLNNVDAAAPVIEGFTQDTTGWTKDDVNVTVMATDDQQLAEQAFLWEFTPNSTGVPVLGSWTSSQTFTVTDAGKVRVLVRDSVSTTTSASNVDAHAVWSDYHYVNNIDKIAPSLNTTTPFTLSTTEEVAASTGVTITLNIVDTADTVTGMASGLATLPIKWNEIDGIYTTNRSVTVHANRNPYTVTLMDAVGNTATYNIPITNISTNEPVITDFYGVDVEGDRIYYPIGVDDWAKAPVTLHVEATFGDVGPHDKPYSWDGGATWTSLNTFMVTQNGEYTIIIRDKNGTQETSSIIISNADGSAPVVGMYLYKGQPDDWETKFPGQPCTEADFVWKMRIEAEDLGSGIDTVYTQWDAVTHPASDLPIIFDVKDPMTYQITVTDKAGNVIQAEKLTQWTDLGESPDGPNPNVPITTPDVGGGGFGDSGSAGQPFDANLEDLVFGPDGAYNTKTDTFTPYPANFEGIPVHFNAEVTRNKWATGWVTFQDIKYPVVFNGTYPSQGGTGTEKVLGTGDPIPGYAFIPIEDITRDIQGARIRVTIREWNDEACTDLNKEGTENFYTSVQKSAPSLTYTYNQITDTMNVYATSALSGINKIEYSYDGGAWVEYTGPFQIGEPAPAKIILKATDNLGIYTELEITVADLGLNGSSGGAGSLPQDTMSDSSNSSYHSSNRAADIYIIGGTRGNTDQIPSGSVFDALTGITTP